MSTAIGFHHVSKSYPNYLAVTQGLKNLILSSASRKNEAPLFTKKTVLNNLNFSISAGESVGIIGRNGAGKSTLLGLMAKVLVPDQGKVIVAGRVAPLLELGAGFHPDLSGLENIVLNAVLLGMSYEEALSKRNQIADFAEIGEYIHRPVRSYSSGMKARLGFSVAASLDPNILLVDEVLAVGDHSFRLKCGRVFSELRSKGTTVVLVSHSPSQVKEICTRSIWIENGTIRQDGPTEDVLEQYISQSSSC